MYALRDMKHVPGCSEAVVGYRHRPPGLLPEEATRLYDAGAQNTHTDTRGDAIAVRAKIPKEVVRGHGRFHALLWKHRRRFNFLSRRITI